MAIIRFATAVKSAVLAPIITAINAGAAGGKIKVYSGTIPATPATAIGAQVLLGTLTFADPCGTESAGTITMDSITQDSSADATGTASFARITDSNDVVVCDIDITTTGGGGTMQLNTTNIVIGGPILVTAFTITVA
jgi:hypothetical protein